MWETVYSELNGDPVINIVAGDFVIATVHCIDQHLLGEAYDRMEENASLIAAAPDLLKDTMILRKLLWLRHGCSFFDLYRDDGEMQCCKCFIDFKRDSVELIKRKFMHINQVVLSEYLKDEHAISVLRESEGKNE